jgi:hypothetical protein
MSKPPIRVSAVEAANDFPSRARRAEVVIERDAKAVAVLRPAGLHVRLLPESLRLAKARGSNSTPDDEFGRHLKTVAGVIRSGEHSLTASARFTTPARSKRRGQ